MLILVLGLNPLEMTGSEVVVKRTANVQYCTRYTLPKLKFSSVVFRNLIPDFVKNLSLVNDPL